jgi:MFS transporter, DHA3 family, macrolide efflux protein
MKQQNKELGSFYIFLFGQFVSQFGSKLTSYGLVLWAYKQSGSVLSVAMLSICYLLPEILLNFIAGSVSDHWNKKRIMLAADSIAAAASCCIIVMLVNGQMRVEYLYLINVVLGITDAFQSPASEVAVTLIVSKENYIKTSGMQSLCNAFTSIFYPVIATAIYAFGGLVTIIYIDLGTFIFAFVTLAAGVKIPKIQHKSASNESLWHKCTSGMKYIQKAGGIKELIAFMAFVNLIAAMYNTNLSPMILARTGNNDIQLGIVSGTIGIAGLIGSILVNWLAKDKKKIRMILNIMSFSFLVCNSMLGIGRNYYVWSIAVFLGNVFIPILTANVTYLMRTLVPVEMQGRVFSARNTLQYTAIPIGNLLGGLFSDKVFEPFMLGTSRAKEPFVKLVGTGAGSGIALLFVFLGVAGFLGCCIFRSNRKLRRLDETGNEQYNYGS